MGNCSGGKGFDPPAPAVNEINATIEISIGRQRVFVDGDKAFLRAIGESLPDGGPGVAKRLPGYLRVDKAVAIDEPVLGHGRGGLARQKASVVQLPALRVGRILVIIV